MAKRHFSIPKVAGAMALALMLAACSGDGDSRAELRKLAGVTEAQATPLPSPQPESTERVKIIEATRIVEIPQPAQIIEVTRESVQQVEVTRIVEVVITPTADIQGFQDSGIDESIEPCPIPFWRNGRCDATEQQIEDYANEVTR